MNDIPAGFRRLITGSYACKTRLHDQSGQMVTVDRLLRNGTRAAKSWFDIKLFDKRAPLPWISYDAQRVIDDFLTRHMTVLEYGSGMATRWYAERAGKVTAIESHHGWYESVKQQLAGLANAEIRWADERDAYVAPLPERDYDLIIVDGLWRDACAEYATHHLAPGGMIYLDNSDREYTQTDGSIRHGRELLIAFAIKNGLPVRKFTDFVPGNIAITQGLMIGGPAL